MLLLCSLKNQYFNKYYLFSVKLLREFGDEFVSRVELKLLLHHKIQLGCFALASWVVIGLYVNEF